MYYFHQLSNLWVRALCCNIMSEDSERKSHKGSAGWIIVGIVAGLAVIFIVVIAFSSTLFPSGPGTGGPPETADQSATSGPGHNTTTAGGNVPSETQDEAVANTGPATEQIPDSEVTFGRETSTIDTPTAQEQGLNNTGNRTNGGLENPLSENLTSLTGTSGTS
jgi:cytoskeletal protein RodZ